jgi:hypothetical protein
MAKFKPGPVVAAVSGSIGGTVFSHNRGGAYMRLRSIPANPQTIYQQNIRSFLALLSQNWRSLSQEGQAAWANWATQNPITDALGESVTLSGHQAFIKLNHRLLQAGDSIITVPPIVTSPVPLLTLSAAADESDSSLELTFTTTPLPAAVRLMVWAASTNSQGIHFVANRYRLINISAKAATTGLDVGAAAETRLGDLIENQKIHIMCATLDSTTGLASTPLSCTCIVAA